VRLPGYLWEATLLSKGGQPDLQGVRQSLLSRGAQPVLGHSLAITVAAQGASEVCRFCPTARSDRCEPRELAVELPLGQKPWLSEFLEISPPNLHSVCCHYGVFPRASRHALLCGVLQARVRSLSGKPKPGRRVFRLGHSGPTTILSNCEDVER